MGDFSELRDFFEMGEFFLNGRKFDKLWGKTGTIINRSLRLTCCGTCFQVMRIDMPAQYIVAIETRQP